MHTDRRFAAFISSLVLMLGACDRAEPPAGSSTETPSASEELSDQEISDAYIYVMGRLLVTRQQRIDFDTEGLAWNQLVHRKPGGVDWPNPNLDVAYSEAWVAVDETSCTLLTVPKITGRYYTVHFLNGWGETVANINERVFPDHPSGEFAVCLKGASVAIPEGAVRVDLPVKYTRVLARVELGSNWDEAVALQHQFQMKPTGTPNLPEIPKTLLFDGWPGVEAFDSAELALDSEVDINPGMETVQANARAVARAVKDPADRARVDAVIKERAMADLAKASPVMGHGTMKNGWATPSTSGVYGDDWLTRTLVNFGGIWANVQEDVIYYRCNLDSDGALLESDNSYRVTFPADDLPSRYAKYFWSVIAVDAEHFRVLPNPMNRFLLNNQSKLEYGKDGSLTLYFAPEKPADAPEGNWLPTPKGQLYRLTFRFYGPQGGVADHTYFPPPLHKE